MTTFVDTNVLLYAFDADQREKHEVAAAIIEGLWESKDGVLSTQVLQELYVNLTRKLREPMTRPRARSELERYATWPVHQVTPDDILAASELEQRHTLAFWNALIIVAARQLGADVVLTEDVQHGRTFGDVRVQSPFRGDLLVPTKLSPRG